MNRNFHPFSGAVASRAGAALAAAAVAVALAGAPALAGDKRVKVTNGTSGKMVLLQSKRPGGSWSANILRGRTLAPGGSASVNFGNGGSNCTYDIRAEFSNDTEQVVRNLDVCRVGEVNYADEG